VTNSSNLLIAGEGVKKWLLNSPEETSQHDNCNQGHFDDSSQVSFGHYGILLSYLLPN